MRCWITVIICLGLLMACAQIAPKKSSRQMADEAIQRAEYQKAYDLVIDKAAAGDAELQYTVATLIANGFGPPGPLNRDQLTLSWVLKSAEQGYHDALLWLADAYKNGWLGLDKEPEAERCWRALAVRFDPASAALCRRPLITDAVDSEADAVAAP